MPTFTKFELYDFLPLLPLQIDDNGEYNFSLIQSIITENVIVLQPPSDYSAPFSRELVSKLSQNTHIATDMVIKDTTISALYSNNKALNSDVTGYIFIPNSIVSYPILHKAGSDNYYLSKDIYHRQSSSGSIYLDDNCDNLSSEVKLIHGHSMKNGSMFRFLLNYKEQKYADSHRYIYIYNDSQLRQYEVFACVIVNADNETVPISFGSDDERLSYYKTVLERSKIESQTTPNFSDVIILNTCSYEPGNMRALVYGYQVSSNVDKNNFLIPE